MKDNSRKVSATRFLTVSFIAIIVVSIFAFTSLGIYMSGMSHNAFHKISKIYATGISEQISSHFQSVINLRFDQLDGLISVVPEDTAPASLESELSHYADVRDFKYVALCAEDGSFVSVEGNSFKPLNPDPYIEGIKKQARRVAVGVDSKGNELVLFGSRARYTMPNGEKSIGLVCAVPAKYIVDFLELDEKDAMLSLCILREDGSYVTKLDNNGIENYDEALSKQLKVSDKSSDYKYSEKAFNKALKNGKNYSATVMFNGEEQKVYSIALPNSEWNLVSLMPNNQINQIMSELNVKRTGFTILSCLTVLIVMMIIFIQYFKISNKQIDQINESRMEATEASRAKSEFLANMSHDIRTPMNAIVGLTAIASANLDDTKQVKNCLKKIALSSKQLLGLINDVLDMSKIESGKMQIASKNTSLKEVMEGIVTIMQPQIKAKRQTFDVHVDNIQTENVWCDGIRLNQVLLNILSNATKYTPDGGTIRLSMFEEASPKGDDFVRINIKVKDNGIGMTPEFLERLYDSYSRADSARVNKVEGTGLGMAITKYIIDAMGGKIDVSSEENVGTEFSLTLDFEKADASESELTLPHCNMLIVDDDELVCKSAIESLNSLGVSGEWCLCGEDAIEKTLRRHEEGDDYQFVLLDWKLPDMNGINVAKRLRAHLDERVPIILISAYDCSELEEEAREAGINGFISKPLFKSTLYYNLRKYIEDAIEEIDEADMEGIEDLKILLAEDNELNWEVASELLQELGPEIEWAEDGEICLDKFSKSEEGYYDAILMDIRMPRMNGYEATAAIRALDRPDARTIPIIAMSADAFAEDIKRCLDCGMNDHTAKPIDIEEVVSLLRKYCGK